MTELDSPGIDLVREHVPELVPRLDAVLAALEAVKVARERVEQAREPVPAAPWGEAVREALAVDVDAVREGRRPGAYAGLVAARPQLEGELRAVEGFAEAEVRSWNSGAHKDVKAETVKRLVADRDVAERDCREAARAAMVAAAAIPASDDARRLRAALAEVGEMEAQVARWRILSALVGWVTWRRPVTRAYDEWYWRDVWPDGPEVTEARCLADDGLRFNERRRRVPQRAR